MKIPKKSIPMHIQSELGYYVYALRDPRNAEVFYIGKGKGERIIQHVAEAGKNVDKAAESIKLSRIKEIEAAGKAVEHLFIRFGIKDEPTAFIVEQAVIDAFQAAGVNLANKVKGHHSDEFGLASIDATLAKFEADPLPRIDEPLIMLTINQLWTADMSPTEIMDATHGYWSNVSAKVRTEAKFAFAIAFGIVRGVYRIGEWHASTIEGHKNRWWFEASEAPEMAHLVGKHVKDATVQGNANPYRNFIQGYVPKNGSK